MTVSDKQSSSGQPDDFVKDNKEDKVMDMTMDLINACFADNQRLQEAGLLNPAGVDLDALYHAGIEMPHDDVDDEEVVDVVDDIDDVDDVDGIDNTGDVDDDSNPPAPPSVSVHTVDDIIQKATDDYIRCHTIRLNDLLNAEKVAVIRSELMDSISHEMALENAIRKQQKQKPLKEVTSFPIYSIAALMLATHDFRIVRSLTGGERIGYNLYDRNGKYTGIMKMMPLKQTGGKNVMATICRRLNPSIKGTMINDIITQVEAELSDPCKADEYTTYGNTNHRLIACNNGIWDYDTKEFTPHDSPERWTKYPDVIFLNKLATNWCPVTTSPSFVQPDGTIWTVDSFIESLFDVTTPIGRASADIIWEIIQFALRGYSGKDGHMVYGCNASDRARGQNGKTTLVNLIMFIIDHFAVPEYAARHQVPADRAINGTKVLVCSIDKWHKDFILAENIMSAMFLYSDENEEGTNYIDGSGFLKNIARHQPNLYNAKYGSPFTYAYQGVAWHNQNETTKMNSTDDANFKHRIELRFEKDFSADGGGNSDVKDKYVIDEKVAEYVLYKITQMPCLDDFSKDLLDILQANIEDTKRDNIPVDRFLDEVLPGFDMSIVPFPWLYEMYDKSWRVSEGIIKKLTKQQFKKDLHQYLYKHRDEYEWYEKAFYFKQDMVDYEVQRSVLHPALRDYGMLDNFNSLSFAQVDTLKDKHYTGRIAKIAMLKQFTSGAIVKKDYQPLPLPAKEVEYAS